MKIDNPFGNNTRLSQMCDILETTDISKQLDEFSEEEFAEYVTDKSCVDIHFDVDYPENYGVYLVRDAALLDNNDFYMLLANQRCVAYLCAYEEGPDWERPLNYLKDMLDYEMKKWRLIRNVLRKELVQEFKIAEDKKK